MGRTVVLILLVAVNLAAAVLLWGLSRRVPATVVVVWAAREDLPAVLAAAAGSARPGWHDAAGLLGQVFVRHGLVERVGNAVELAPSAEARAAQARIRAAQEEARALEQALGPAGFEGVDAWARLRERLSR